MKKKLYLNYLKNPIIIKLNILVIIKRQKKYFQKIIFQTNIIKIIILISIKIIAIIIIFLVYLKKMIMILIIIISIIQMQILIIKI